MNGKGLNINMDFKQWLSEMPIGNAALLGKGWNKDFPQDKSKDQHFDRASFNMLKGDARRDFSKLKKSFKMVKETIDTYFIKNPGMGKFSQQGEVNPEYLEQLGIDIPEIDRSHITIFYTNNIGDQKMPLTPWTIAHRLGHAVASMPSYGTFMQHIEKDFRELLELIYGLEKPSPVGAGSSANRTKYIRFTKKLMSELGTMRSARENQIAREGEFYHELFAQSIIQNKIEFKKEIPKQLIIDFMYGNPKWDGSAYSKVHQDEYMLDYVVELLESNARHYKILANLVLAEAVGKIFVM